MRRKKELRVLPGESYATLEDIDRLYHKYLSMQQEIAASSEETHENFNAVTQHYLDLAYEREIVRCSKANRVAGVKDFALLDELYYAMAPEWRRLWYHLWLWKTPNTSMKEIIQEAGISAQEELDIERNFNADETQRVIAAKQKLDETLKEKWQYLREEEHMSSGKLRRLKRKYDKLKAIFGRYEESQKPQVKKSKKKAAEPARVISQTPGQLPGQINIDEVDDNGRT